MVRGLIAGIPAVSIRELVEFVAEHDPKVAGAMLDKLVVSENPASDAQKGNQNAVRDKGNQTLNLANGLPPQQDRAKANGISVPNQRKLDKIAAKSPAHLDEIQAGTKTIHRAAVELGIVKVRTPLELLDYCGEVLKDEYLNPARIAP